MLLTPQWVGADGLWLLTTQLIPWVCPSLPGQVGKQSSSATVPPWHPFDQLEGSLASDAFITLHPGIWHDHTPGGFEAESTK